MSTIQTTREGLIKPLQQISNVVEKRQTLPILSNVMFSLQNGRLTLTATDLEIELKTHLGIDSTENVDFTIPARKLFDITRALPEGADIEIKIDGDHAVMRSERSRFKLGVLPANDFPSIDARAATHTVTLKEAELKKLFAQTLFAMAQQDVRYYLNGLLIELTKDKIRAVATDGHRLALCEIDTPNEGVDALQVILPRKAVLEVNRLIADSDENITIEIGSNHACFSCDNWVFTTKLIDGRFPDYQRVIPDDNPKVVTADRLTIKSALQRASILSNEKYRGIRIELKQNLLKLVAHNPEQEEATEEVAVDYDSSEEIVIGFNVGYLIDALNALESESVEFQLNDSNSSGILRDPDDQSVLYVVMPMRL